MNLWLVKDLQRYLRTLPGITSSVSIVDYLELLESGLNTGSDGDMIVDEHGIIRHRLETPDEEQYKRLAEYVAAMGSFSERR